MSPLWLVSGSILCFAMFVFIVKRMFPGISFTALRTLKLKADAIASIPLLTLSVDRTGVISAVHSIPSEFTDHFSTDCVGRNWCDFIHKDFHPLFTNLLEKALSGFPGSFQYSIRSDSGIRWYECHIIKASENILTLAVSEITESKIIKEKLEVAFDSDYMTSFVYNVDSMTVTFDREDFVRKWSGNNTGRVMRFDELTDLLSQPHRESLLGSLNRVVSSDERVSSVKIEFPATSGSESSWVVVKGLGVSRDSSGRASMVLGIVRDITTSVQSENQLKTLNLMFRNVLDAIPAGLYWKDDKLKYQGASRVFLKDTGLCSGDYIDENLWITEKSRQIEQQVIATGESILNRQEKFSLPDSTDRTINISRVPLKSHSGSITGLMVTYEDVTENIRFRDELVRRKEFLSGLVDNLPVGFFAKDPSSGMTYRIWNRQMEQIFGFSPSEAVDKRDWNLFGTNAAAILKSDDEALLVDPDSGKTAKTYKVLGRNGLKTVSIVRVLLYDDLLDTTLVAGVVDDITRENDLENQLRQAQKMEAVGRLAGGVAHDFNNLLQVITGAAEIGSVNSQSSEKSFRQILQASEKAMFLTRQLLSFSRDEGFNKRVFSVDHRVGEFVRMVHRIIDTNAKLEFIPGAPGARINGDPFQLEQVLMNLLVNARDAITGNRRGFINVETSVMKVCCFAGGEPVECAVVSVSDTGDGIPEDIRDKIFEPFFTTKVDGKGTGLGLASSYGIVAKHDGIILLDSIPGEGTRFDVCIPLYQGSLERSSDRVPEDQMIEPFEALTILLAEDEEMVREIARTVLESAGHVVIEAQNGEEAVKLFFENKDAVDVLVFDAMMPLLNGSEAFSRIHETVPDVPVLFCTGYSRDSLFDSFAGDARTQVLQKPYAAADLLKTVENLKRKK